MCLNTNEKKIKTAKKPIKVYKSIFIRETGVYSAVQFYRLAKKECILNELEFIEVNSQDGKYEIEEGLHAKTKAKYVNFQGYVSEWVIPIGAKYVLGTYNDIVSDKMEFVQIILDDVKTKLQLEHDGFMPEIKFAEDKY